MLTQGNFRSRSKTRSLKRKRDPSAMDTSSTRAKSVGRSKSRTRDESGVRDPEVNDTWILVDSRFQSLECTSANLLMKHG